MQTGSVLRRLVRCSKGSTFTEYALVAAFIAVALAVGIAAVGGQVLELMTKVETDVRNSSS